MMHGSTNIMNEDIAYKKILISKHKIDSEIYVVRQGKS